ncbi:MAG: Ni/Fe-hydrogenase cytochrome b subunit [Deltaproteobacteria bacterium]|nr:Ni/Fe-hydrogenase cytochrome b subunit [Deltaproteobacteria bacterium]
MDAPVQPKPVGGAVFNLPMILLLSVFAIAGGVMGYRFVAGLGAVSNMNDGYPWGIWEPVNVVVFTGLGAGAYSVSLLCYLLNRGRYHALVRPAVLLGAIAYTLGGFSIVVAVGRPWNLYWMALPSMWNLRSVLLEVAVCVTVYIGVLWIEMLPAVLDQAARSGSPARAARARRWGGRLTKAMPFIVALAMVMPTMHQSSLGGLMIIAGQKLHPLWHTSLLPLLALVSSLSMGLGSVVLLAAVMRRTWNARQDRALLGEMGQVNGGLLVLFAVLRLGDLWLSGKLPLLAVPGFYGSLFALEMALLLVPAAMLLSRRVPSHRVRVGAALLAVVGAALWRVDAFLTCYSPGEAWSYRPSLGELVVTVGIAALGVALFIAISKRFPVVVVEESASLLVPAPIAAFGLALPQQEAAPKPLAPAGPAHPMSVEPPQQTPLPPPSV